MMDLVKPFMQQEDPAVLEMEARRVLSLANTRGIQ